MTIEIPAVWVPLKGARTILVDVEDGDPGEQREAWVLRDGTEIPAWWGEAGGRWESPDGRSFFDAGAADRAGDFFPTYLTHHIGEFAGLPFELLPYQKALLTRPLFGWKKASDGLRRFRKVFGFIPKGGGKSPWGAGTGLYLTGCDNEPASEVYAVAADTKQARTVHDNAKVMIEQSDELSSQFEIFRDSIVHADTRSKYQVLSSDAKTKHGFRPHGVIFDEFHAQPTRDVYEALKKSMVKRRQPVMILITHAGHDDEGICVAPDTRLMTDDLRWVDAKDVRVGDLLAGFDEHRSGTAHRSWRRSTVEARQERTQLCYELILTDGTRVVCSADHMWLVQTAGRRVVWRKTKELTPTDEFFKVSDPWRAEQSWEAGWMAALYDGEGHLTQTHNAKLLAVFTQRANSVLAAGTAGLDSRGIRYGVSQSSPGVYQVAVTRKRDVLRLLGSVRPIRLLERFREIGFDRMRFKSFAHPKLASKRFIGPHTVISLRTSTRTFVAEGLASHNCYEEYEYAKGVLVALIEDDSCLPVIFEATPQDDFADPKVWARVNPGHGITVQHEGIAAECLEAQNDPRKRNDFLMFHLNRWVNQAVAWILTDSWDACDKPIPPLAELVALQGAIGIDMSQKIDLASAVAVLRLPLPTKAPALEVDVVSEAVETAPTGEEVKTVVKTKHRLNYEIVLVPAFWLPGETLKERVKKDRLPYDKWVEEGLLFETDGFVIDSDAICDYIRPRSKDKSAGLVGKFPMLKEGRVGYDPAFATEVALELDDRGLTVVEVPQNYTHLSEACQVFEALVKAGRVRHGGHRLLRQHVENVMVKRDDAGRIRPVKPRRQTKRIDGVVATLIGLSQLIRMPVKPPRGKRGRAMVFTPDGFKEVGGSDAQPTA